MKLEDIISVLGRFWGTIVPIVHHLHECQFDCIMLCHMTAVIIYIKLSLFSFLIKLKISLLINTTILDKVYLQTSFFVFPYPAA